MKTCNLSYFNVFAQQLESATDEEPNNFTYFYFRRGKKTCNFLQNQVFKGRSGKQFIFHL